MIQVAEAPPLARLAAELSARRLPPVERWDPPFCGDSGIVIARDGRWLHEGAPITRPAMVQLFAGVLRRDPEGYRLVTPVEKLAVTVEDLPFLAVELASEGEGLVRRLGFRLNSGDAVIAGPDHPIEVDAGNGLPALHVRAGLWARIGRPVWYELCQLAIDERSDPAGLWSEGRFFPLAPAA